MSRTRPPQALADRKRAAHKERNRLDWLRHHRHCREWPIAGCRICEDAPRDHDPVQPATFYEGPQ
jgi:hypothetical protein